MACSKYTLTNTGDTSINFSYQRCNDALWQYQVELFPGQTKNIWLIDGTYTIPTLFSTSIELVDGGVFPLPDPTPTPTPVTQTPTPSNSPTPSITPTNTETPTQTPTNTATPTNTSSNTATPTQTPTDNVTDTPTPTPTQTPTPTEPIRYNQADICHSEFDGFTVCDCAQLANVFTNGVDMASSTLMWSDTTGPNTGNPEGFYLQDGIIYQVASDCGVGCTTGASITVYGICPSITPTNTPTQTATPSETPTNTPTNTPTLSPFNNFVFFNSSTIATVESVYDDSGPIALSNIVGIFPVPPSQNTTAVHGTTGTNPTASLTGTGSVDFILYVNGLLLQSLTTTLPISIGLTSGGVPLTPADIVQLNISDTPVTPTPTPTNTLTPSETPTNTPTNTSTPTETPTNTPTPTVTPSSVTGYSYNLIALPYNFPTDGNAIMNAQPPAQTGTTLINELSITGRGFYFNAIDTTATDRTSYYSGFTGESITITFTQAGDSAIYSGDTSSFKEWIQPPYGSGFVFGTGISTPQITGQTGTAILLQSATTTWSTGATVYVSAQINP